MKITISVLQCVCSSKLAAGKMKYDMFSSEVCTILRLKNMKDSLSKSPLNIDIHAGIGLLSGLRDS